MISIRRFTDKELMILVVLADDKGHALWDLDERTGIKKSNLIPKIDSLMKRRIIYKGAARKTRNKSSSHPNDTERPYYIIPQRYFLIREDLQSSFEGTQSKLRHKYEKKQKSSVDEESIKRLGDKLDLYRRLLSEFETGVKNLRIISPKDRISGKYEVEESKEPEFEPGALSQWSPAQAEIDRIAREIEELCISRNAAEEIVCIIRPELYASHDKWIEDHLPMLPKDLL